MTNTFVLHIPNRPIVARAVLKTALPLIDRVSQRFFNQVAEVEQVSPLSLKGEQGSTSTLVLCDYWENTSHFKKKFPYKVNFEISPL